MPRKGNEKKQKKIFIYKKWLPFLEQYKCSEAKQKDDEIRFRFSVGLSVAAVVVIVSKVSSSETQPIRPCECMTKRSKKNKKKIEIFWSKHKKGLLAYVNAGDYAPSAYTKK